MAELPSFVEERLHRLPKGLRDHIKRARVVGRALALHHGVDEDLVDLGIACHDLARALNPDALLEQASHYDLKTNSVERHEPLLLHGAVAAAWLEHEDGITDSCVLSAVRWHTTGKRGMDAIEKAVFLADKLDPQKVARYPYLEKVKKLAKENLDNAILYFIDQNIAYFIRESRAIHPASIDLRNELMLGDSRSSG